MTHGRGADISGVEEELHVVDLESWQLSPSASRLLRHLGEDDGYSSEMQRSTVETRTDVTSSLGDLRAEMTRLRARLSEVAEPAGWVSPPSARHRTPRPKTSSSRPPAATGMMQEQYRMLVDEQLICGLQVHVGVSDRDLAVQVSQRVSWILPVLLALSASSPYWNGKDTGYASIRSIIWQRWPSAGPTGPLSSAAEYDDLVEDLIQDRRPGRRRGWRTSTCGPPATSRRSSCGCATPVPSSTTLC